jgi:ribokinase
VSGVVRALVVGSTNVDLVLDVAALPGPGETALSHAQRREPGGKGANQAAALARLGATVTLVSAVGDDEHGRWSLEQLTGVDVTQVETVDAATGLAVVLVDRAGENTIVVSPGANRLVQPPSAYDADVVLLSLEVPLDVVTLTAAAARTHGCTVVLNAAPAHPLPPELLAAVDVLVVNETEAEGIDTDAVATVVTTLGAAGCVVVQGPLETQVPGIAVDVVDTTGAGDCFAAALAYALATGRAPRDAARFAVAAAALSVTQPGARGGHPTRAETTALAESAGRR